MPIHPIENHAILTCIVKDDSPLNLEQLESNSTSEYNTLPV